MTVAKNQLVWAIARVFPSTYQGLFGLFHCNGVKDLFLTPGSDYTVDTALYQYQIMELHTNIRKEPLEAMNSWSRGS